MDVKNLEKQFQDLRPLMFPGIFDKLNQADDKCDKLSKQILITMRSNHYNLFADVLYEHHKQGPKAEAILESGYQEPNDILRIYEPLEVQSITMLLKYTLSDPPRFVNALLQHSKRPEFYQLAILTVPAVFSFYSTKETMGFAFNFLMELSRTKNFDLFTIFISPILNSTACSVFINLLFKKIFWANFDSDIKEKEISQLLLNEAIPLFKFLPETVVVLLRMLLLQWGEVEIWKILARTFLFPQLLLQVSAKPFNHVILDKINTLKIKSYLYSIGKKKCLLNIPHLEFGSSYKEIPETFIPYQHSFALDLILTVSDIKNLISISGEIPHHTKRLQGILDSTAHPPLAPFYIHFFPKMLVPPPMGLRNLFTFPKYVNSDIQQQSSMAQLWSTFETATVSTRSNPFDLLKQSPIHTGEYNLDLQLNHSVNLEEFYHFGLDKTVKDLCLTAETLEKLLEHSMNSSTLNNWLIECRNYENINAMQSATSIISRLNFKLDHIQSNLWDYVSEYGCGSRSISYWLAVLFLEKIELNFLMKYKKEVVELQQLYRNYLILKNAKINSAPSFKNSRLKSAMWEASGSLQFANHQSKLSKRYIILNSYIEQVELIIAAEGIDNSLEKTAQILEFSFSECKQVWILETILILSCGLFNNENFALYAPPQLIDRWRKFAAAFIRFLSHDINIITKYNDFLTNTI